jgi:hypothetical protein
MARSNVSDGPRSMLAIESSCDRGLHMVILDGSISRIVLARPHVNEKP